MRKRIPWVLALGLLVPSVSAASVRSVVVQALKNQRAINARGVCGNVICMTPMDDHYRTIGKFSDRAVPTLRGIINDPQDDLSMKETAVYALSYVGTARAIKILQDLLDERVLSKYSEKIPERYEDPSFRLALAATHALYYLVKDGKERDRALRLLQKQLEHPVLREYVVSDLGRTGRAENIPVLQQFLQRVRQSDAPRADSRERLVLDTLVALAQCGDTSLVETMIRMVEEGSSRGYQGLAALAPFSAVAKQRLFQDFQKFISSDEAPALYFAVHEVVAGLLAAGIDTETFLQTLRQGKSSDRVKHILTERTQCGRAEALPVLQAYLDDADWMRQVEGYDYGLFAQTAQAAITRIKMDRPK